METTTAREGARLQNRPWDRKNLVGKGAEAEGD